MSSKLRVMIADDERPARSFPAATLRGFEDVEIVGEASNGSEALEIIEKKKPDLALLDLQMPELDGLGVVRLLRKSSMPLVAFVTAYDEFAVRAFEINAVDYFVEACRECVLTANTQPCARATRAVRFSVSCIDSLASGGSRLRSRRQAGSS